MEYNNLIIKYLNNTLSEEETKELLAWLKKSKDNVEHLCKLEAVYESKQQQHLLSTANTAKEWNKLETLIARNNNHQAQIHEIKTWKRIFAYAASALVLLGLGVAFAWQISIITHLKQPIIVQTQKGERSTLHLPDGSKIQLNSQTRVEYRYKLLSKERHVSLTGEAYFDVAQDKKRPFIVTSKKLQTRVLGTKFNIRSYLSEPQTITTLIEGSIRLSAVTAQGMQHLTLKPGEQVICQDNTGSMFYHYDPNEVNEIPWLQNKLAFYNKPLSYIVQELERTFDVEISLSNQTLSNVSFTCLFENGEGLLQIMEVLSQTKKITYTSHGRLVVIHPPRTTP